MIKIEIPDPEKLSISFSGGETSAMMTKLLKDQYPDALVVFANTGQEREETLDFVHQCDQRWGWGVVWVEAVVNTYRKGCTAKVVNYDTAARKGEPFEGIIKKYGIPNIKFPHCSRTLKREPIADYRKRIFGKDKDYVAIGIRADEIDRMSISAKRDRILYPLIDLGITKNDVNLFWANQGFRLNLKGYEGNCKWCWKKSYRKLLTIAKEDSSAFAFPLEMERKYEFHIPPSQEEKRVLPIRFFRNNVSTSEIIQRSASESFAPATDDTRVAQATLFPLLDLDITNGCEDSCEIY